VPDISLIVQGIALHQVGTFSHICSDGCWASSGLSLRQLVIREFYCCHRNEMTSICQLNAIFNVL